MSQMDPPKLIVIVVIRKGGIINGEISFPGYKTALHEDSRCQVQIPHKMSLITAQSSMIRASRDGGTLWSHHQ